MDEFTADAWHDLLGDYGLEECRRAVIAVASRQPFAAASEIIAEVKREHRAELGRQRREQLERDMPRGELCPGGQDTRMLREDIDKIFDGWRARLEHEVPAPARVPAPQPSPEDLEAERRRQLAALEQFMRNGDGGQGE